MKLVRLPADEAGKYEIDIASEKINFESIACIRPALPVDSLLEKLFFR
jgi:hypothetical protein